MKTTIIITTCLVCLVSLPAFAEVKIVGGATYSTITQAVANAVDGDVLLVSTGKYYETVDIDGLDITIDGDYDAAFTGKILTNARTEIEAPLAGLGSVMEINSANVRLESLWFKGGSFAPGDAIGYGGGLNIGNGSVVTGVSLMVLGNSAKGYGGGIFVSGSSLVISNAAVRSNTAELNNAGSAAHGGGIAVSGGSLTLNGKVEVAQNEARLAGGGIYMMFGSHANFHDESPHMYMNSAQEGGAIAADASQFTINAVHTFGTLGLINRSTAATRGGAILLLNGSTGALYGVVTTVGGIGSFSGPNIVTNGDGGGVYCSDSVLIVSNGACIGNNYAERNGGGVYLTNSMMILADNAAIGYPDADWTNVAHTGRGGGIYMIDSTLIAHGNAEILRGNSYHSGGGIYAKNSVLNLSDGVVIGGAGTNGNVVEASGYVGGGIYASSCETSLDDVSVLNNYAFAGGGLFISGTSTFNAVNTLIAGNECWRGGGIGFQSATGDMMLDACTVVSNISPCSTGGGISMWMSGPLDVRNGTEIMYNFAGESGGGVYLIIDSAMNMVVADGAACVISHNTSGEDGAGVYAYDSTLGLRGNVLIEHNEGGYGGGLCAYGESVIVCAPTNDYAPAIRGNIAQGRGGGICVGNGAVLTAINCSVEYNHGLQYGGGLYASNASVYIDSERPSGLSGIIPPSVFIGNVVVSNGHGGAIAMECAATGFIANAFIASNSASYGGGVYVREDSVCALVNLVIVNNSADYAGGGVRSFDSATRMLQCTVANNDDTGVESSLHDTLVMTNCIVWGHAGTEVSANKNVNYCDIDGGYATGEGNIDADPLFINTSALDYQLSELSPCIDTGIYAGVDYDCIGVPRPQDDGYDLGAYEFVPEPVLFEICHLAFVIYYLRRRRSR